MRKSSNYILQIFLLVTIIISGCNGTHTGKVEVVSFQKDIAEDATPEVLVRILEAGEKPISEIKFEKGVYHFYPDKAMEYFCNISNHNDVLTKAAFPLKEFNNLTIDGQGSLFIFHGNIIPFLIDNCTNINVKNVSIDWSVPFHSEAKVVARDEANKTFDLEISDDYPYEIRNGQLYFIKEYYEHHLGQAILYDPNRNAIAFNTESYTPLTMFQRNEVSNNVKNVKYKYTVDPLSLNQRIIGRELSLKVEQLKPGLVRVYNHRKKLPPVGMVLVCKGEQSYNRLAPAFRITHTDGFNATNVNVHHAGGMGLIAENSKDLILDGFNVTPSNGRMVSTTADATHFVGCRGDVVLKNCTFNNQLDDASNVHGTYQVIEDIIDEYTLGVRMGHFQQQGFVIGRTNDTIGMVRLSESFFPYTKHTIKGIQKINGRYQKITFNEKLSENIQVGDLLENLNAYPELLVENCTISRNRARGLLLSTPKKTIIRNNFFHTEMEALLIPVESGHWYESGSVTNLIVTGNTFQDCNHSGLDRGVIRFIPDDENENIAFRNIEITNNTFNHFDTQIMEVANTDNLVFKANIITLSGTFPQLFPDNPVIEIKSSVNIVVENEVYSGNKNLKFGVDEAFAEL